ncbi:hypothetical protein WDW86_02765 [Bdellovibrionota bacterium FG-2]
MGVFGVGRSIPRAIIIILLAFAAPAFAHAAAESAGLGELCGEALAHPEKAPTKYSYCKAAQDSQATSEAESKLWKVWAGVATVCAGACASSLSGASAHPWVCQSANGLAGVIEGGIKKDLTAAMGGLTAAGAGAVMTKATESGASAKSKDWAACAGAAFAAAQSYAKHKTMTESEAAVATNLESVKKFKDSSGGGFAQTAPNTSLSVVPRPNSGAGVPAGAAPQSAEPVSPLATGAKSQAMIAGAMAADRKLPQWVSDPKFAEDFKKVSKTDVAELIDGVDGKFKDPSSALNTALSGSFSAPSVSTLALALKELESAPGADSSGVYAGGGAADGSAKAGASPDQSMSEMLSGIFGQFGAKSGAGKKISGGSEIVFNPSMRSPAAIFEDRTLSLFDRVKFRYSRVSDRLEGAGR